MDLSLLTRRPRMLLATALTSAALALALVLMLTAATASARPKAHHKAYRVHHVMRGRTADSSTTDPAGGPNDQSGADVQQGPNVQQGPGSTAGGPDNEAAGLEAEAESGA